MTNWKESTSVREMSLCTLVLVCKRQLGRQDGPGLEHVSFFVIGHLILWVYFMLYFVSGDCQWSLEFSLHQGHRLILVFEVLYCSSLVMFFVSVVPFILSYKGPSEYN